MPFLSAIVECPRCACEFSGVWHVTGDIQDLAEAPVADKTCPSCGKVWSMEYPGWTLFTEAG
jgi:hypothetical protein